MKGYSTGTALLPGDAAGLLRLGQADVLPAIDAAAQMMGDGKPNFSNAGSDWVLRMPGSTTRPLARSRAG
jgi:hypothetical protein